LRALVLGFAHAHRLDVTLLDMDDVAVVEARGRQGTSSHPEADPLRLTLHQGDEALGTLVLGPLSAAERAALPEALRTSGAFGLGEAAALHEAALQRAPGLGSGLLQLLRTLQALVDGGLRAREAQREHAQTAMAALQDMAERALHLTELNE